DAAAGDVLGWAEALRACIRSHQRDVELLRPWAMRARVKTGSLDRSATQLESIPNLGDLPDLYDDAASQHSMLEQAAVAHAGEAARSRFGTNFVVGLDVRVPDAVAGDACAGRQPA